MKKIFITVMFAAVTLTSCSDAYDIHQVGVVTEESQAFRTPADIKKGINYVYSMFPGEAEIDFDSYFTDELGIGINNAGQGVNDGSYTFLLQAGNTSAQSIWGSYYGVINRLNRMENRAKEMEQTLDPASSEFKELQLNKAEIYTLRAYCHYKLFAYFTPDYTNPSGLSVIKFDFVQTDNYSRFEKRSTVADIVSFIENDIKRAKDLLIEEINGEEIELDLNGGLGSGYATREMMNAILVKMYSMLQTTDAYNKLEQAFIDISRNKSIADPLDHMAMFGRGGEKVEYAEGIFRLKRISTDGTVQSGVASSWYSDKVGGGTYMEMGRSLFNELDKLDPAHQGTVLTNNDRLDTRFLVSVLASSVVNPGYASLPLEEYRQKDKLFIGKYDGISDARPLMNSLWVFRYTDMLLSLAEKRAFDGILTGNVAIGDYSNVESIIYNIRANRSFNMDSVPVSMPTDFSSPKAAYARILEERRVEFAFEGYRYLDMKRLGVRAGSPGFVRDPQDCVSTNACSLEPSSLKLTMPIPRSEMVSNPNMVQNPGY